MIQTSLTAEAERDDTMNMKKKASLAVLGVILALALSACTAKQTVNIQEKHEADSVQTAENAAGGFLL